MTIIKNSGVIFQHVTIFLLEVTESRIGSLY